MDEHNTDIGRIERVEDLLEHPDPFHIPYGDLQAVQLTLLHNRFVENRDRIPVLQRVADRHGLHGIARLTDVLALLFSHATYKSYPESFLDTGQWDRMNQWVATLSTRGDELKRMDVSGVTSLDDWLTLLDSHDFALCHSSGTSGKPSFLPKSAAEQAMMASSIGATLKLGQGIDPLVDKMPVFCISFKAGWSSIIRSVRGAARAYTLAPDAVDYAFNDTHSPSATRQQMKMSKLAADGRLLPDELADFQRRGTAQRAASAAAFQDFIERTLAYKGQRVMLAGPTAGIFQIAATGLKMGLHSVFAPTSFVIRGSGTKGVTLPENYEELMARYYGIPRQNIVDLYAMTESNSAPLVCVYGRKHVPPWQIPLILDRDGQELLNAQWGHDGVVTGRYAFVDLLASTYWGAITTGDRVTVSFDRCPCGSEGPQILEIARYTDLPDAPDEDKLSCAADMARYVSAALGDQ